MSVLCHQLDDAPDSSHGNTHQLYSGALQAVCRREVYSVAIPDGVPVWRWHVLLVLVEVARANRHGKGQVALLHHVLPVFWGTTRKNNNVLFEIRR